MDYTDLSMEGSNSNTNKQNQLPQQRQQQDQQQDQQRKQLQKQQQQQQRRHNSQKQLRKSQARVQARQHRPYQEYDSITFKQRTSTGRPGSPHRFFQSSFEAKIQNNTGDDTNVTAHDNVDPVSPSIASYASASSRFMNAEINQTNSIVSMEQIVHKHANGLCIVTAGDVIRKAVEELNGSFNSGKYGAASDGKNESEISLQVNKPVITDIEFLREEPANGQSVGGKRKKKAKMMRKGKNSSNNDHNHARNNGMTQPMDTLVIVTLSNGQRIELKSCVSGMIVEMNRRLIADSTSDDDDSDKMKKRNLLVKDPLLDGYLAVIMPSGQFPPPSIVSG